MPVEFIIIIINIINKSMCENPLAIEITQEKFQVALIE